MTDSAKPKPDDLSMREVATFLVDLADRLTKIETQGVEGAAVNEMLRSYRLLKMELEAANNYSAGFFNRAEPLMDRLADIEKAKIEMIDEASARVMEELAKKEKSARSSQLLMQTVASELQADVAAAKVELSDISVDRANLKNSIGQQRANIKIVGDEIYKAKSDIRKVAYEAAENAVNDKVKNMIQEEVARQVRMMMSES